MPKPGMTNYSPHAPSGLQLPPNTYVLVRIGGTLRGERNPFLLDTSPGDRPISYTAVESYERTGRGATHVWLHPGGAFPPPFGGENLSRYVMPDAAGRDMIVLVRVGSVSPQVWTQRDMMTGTYLPGFYCFANAPYCREEVDIAWPGSGVNQWLEDYWLRQSHTVTAVAIPEPLALAGPEVVAPGGTATFTASPSSSDLRLRDRNGQPSAFFWLWYPNDTTSVPPKLNTPEIVCSGPLRATCQFAPKQSGRLRAQTFVEGALVEVDRVVRVQQQKLDLTCDVYSVERGRSIQCSAAANPSGTLDSIRWQFVDSAGHAVRDSSGSASWGGKMVIGGRISVTAILNNSLVADDTVIVVRPRTWPRITVVAADSGNGHLPAAPTRYGELADTHAPYPMQPYATERVASGPNAGRWYLRTPITTVTANVHISDGFNPGTPFYAQQHSGIDPVTMNPFCARSQVSAVERGAREHEGLIASALTSHVEVYQRWFRTNAPQDVMESVTGKDDDFGSTWTFSDMLTQVYIARVAEPAYNDPNQKHTTDNPPGLVAFPAVPCALRF